MGLLTATVIHGDHAWNGGLYLHFHEKTRKNIQTQDRGQLQKILFPLQVILQGKGKRGNLDEILPSLLQDEQVEYENPALDCQSMKQIPRCRQE